MAFGLLAIFRLTDKPTAIGCRIIYDTTSPKQAERSKKMRAALDKERFGPWALVTGASSHQLIVLQRRVSGRVQLTNGDRLFLVMLYRWFPSILKAITITRPETLLRWHRAGFRRYWRWKSRSLGGRPQVDADLRALIRRMSVDNPLWGAPRIHGELLK